MRLDRFISIKVRTKIKESGKVLIKMKSVNNKKSKTQINLQAGYIALIFGILYFLIVAFFNESTIKVTVVALFIALVNVALYNHGVLSKRIFTPLLALAVWVLMDGISIFYANFGTIALDEFLKIFGSFCVALIFLIISPDGEDINGKWIGTVIATCTALGCLVSIDLLSTRLISGAFSAFFNLFTTYYNDISGVEAGIRMTSIFSYANSFAAFAGLGVLISLGLVDTAPAISFAQSSRRGFDRVFPIVLLFINSLGFVLAFSMSALLFIALAFVLFLVFQPKGRKTDLFVLMFETLIVCLPCVFLISRTSLQIWNGFQPIPLLCTVLGSVALTLLHLYVGPRLIPVLRKHPAIIGTVVIAGIAAVCIYLAIGVRLTGSAKLVPGETLTRAIYAKPGTYVMKVESDTPLSITVEDKTKKESMMNIGSIVYEGDGSDISFTLPEDSMIVWFYITAPEGGTIASASIESPTEKYDIPLEYKLIPRFIATRLQGLRVSENMLQRVILFENALKIFSKSPIIGSGIAAFQDNARSVQNYYYVSKYAHNHYVESLVETGIVGLILFIAMLGTAAAAVIRTYLNERKSSQQVAATLTPAFGAAILFMIGHAAMDVDFSFYAFLPVALVVLAVINLFCGNALPAPGEKLKKIFIILVAVFSTVFVVFVALNVSAKNSLEGEVTLKQLDNASKIDFFEWFEESATYVSVATDNYDLLDQNQKKTADRHAAKLAKRDNYDLITVSAYYFRSGRTKEAFDAMERFLDYVRSEDSAWNMAFELLEMYESDDKTYLEGVGRIIKKLDAWNEICWGEANLTEQSVAFVERMRAKTGTLKTS